MTKKILTQIPEVLVFEGYIEEILRETQTKLALTQKEEEKLHRLSKKIEVASAMLDEYALTITRRLERPRTYLQGAEPLPFEPQLQDPKLMKPVFKYPLPTNVTKEKEHTKAEEASRR
jgi:hypothetical protein